PYKHETQPATDPFRQLPDRADGPEARDPECPTESFFGPDTALVRLWSTGTLENHHKSGPNGSPESARQARPVPMPVASPEQPQPVSDHHRHGQPHETGTVASPSTPTPVPLEEVARIGDALRNQPDPNPDEPNGQKPVRIADSQK